MAINQLSMKYLYLLPAFLLATTLQLQAQNNVGINATGATPDASAVLDLNTGNSGNKGFLPEQVALVSSTDATTVATPATGLLVYNTSTAGLTPAGYYYNSGTPVAPLWVLLLTSNSSIATAWNLLGNAGTVDGTSFLGTTDNIPLSFRINNKQAGRIDNALYNSFFGYLAGNYPASTGDSNVAIGGGALSTNTGGSGNAALGSKALFSNTSGGHNTAVGYNALMLNVAGDSNTAVGANALYSNTTGSDNSAFGTNTLYTNTIGDSNTAIGYSSLYSNTTGIDNTASGAYALNNNKGGNYNTANGLSALYKNTSGGHNTASGFKALTANTTGGHNTANGYEALFKNTLGAGNVAEGSVALNKNTKGTNNTASGYEALFSNVTGMSNTGIGAIAGYANTGSNNVFVGDSAGYLNTSGTFNTYVGYQSGVASGPIIVSNTTYLGYNSGIVTGAGTANTVNLGNTSITAIRAQVTSITAYSDKRIKDSIKDNIPGLAFITKLRPVTFYYNIHRENQILGIKDDGNWEGKYDIEKINQSGFIAQEVEAAAKACNYDFCGISKPTTPDGLYGLGYTYFVVPLVKAVQEQQQMIDSLRNLIAKMETIYKNTDAMNSDLKNSQLKDEKDIADLKKLIYSLSEKADASGK